MPSPVVTHSRVEAEGAPPGGAPSRLLESKLGRASLALIWSASGVPLGTLDYADESQDDDDDQYDQQHV